MSDRRLDPAQLKARLVASLATEPARGHLRPAVFSQLTVAETPISSMPATVVEPTISTPAVEAQHVSSRSPQVPVIGVPREQKEPRESKEPKKRPVVHRCDAGAVLRGYRIPLSLHRRAERAKLASSEARGATVFWDEVLQGAIDRLPTDVREIAAGLHAPSGRAEPNPTTRVLQATIRHDQELTLRRLRLDLEEALDRTVRLEEIWTYLVERVIERGI